MNKIIMSIAIVISIFFVNSCNAEPPTLTEKLAQYQKNRSTQEKPVQAAPTLEQIQKQYLEAQQTLLRLEGAMSILQMQKNEIDEANKTATLQPTTSKDTE